MTDKEKLDAVRAEVQNYIYAARKAYTSITEGNFAHLLSFIDSLQEEPVSEEWIEELRTKLDSMSKEDFKKVFDKYAVDFNEEPVSENLEEASKNYADNEEYGDDVYFAIKAAFKAGAKWQREQDQSTIELAEDHAMLAGMEKMKEEMMAKAVDGYAIEDIEEGNGDFLLSADYLPKSMGLKDRQKVKVIVIKED